MNSQVEKVKNNLKDERALDFSYALYFLCRIYKQVFDVLDVYYSGLSVEKDKKLNDFYLILKGFAEAILSRKDFKGLKKQTPKISEDLLSEKSDVNAWGTQKIQLLTFLSTLDRGVGKSHINDEYDPFQLDLLFASVDKAIDEHREKKNFYDNGKGTVEKKISSENDKISVTPSEISYRGERYKPRRGRASSIVKVIAQKIKGRKRNWKIKYEISLRALSNELDGNIEESKIVNSIGAINRGLSNNDIPLEFSARDGSLFVEER